MAAFCEIRENVDLKMWRLRMASSGGFEWLGIETSVGVDGWLKKALTWEVSLEWPVVMCLLRVSAQLQQVARGNFTSAAQNLCAEILMSAAPVMMESVMTVSPRADGCGVPT